MSKLRLSDGAGYLEINHKDSPGIRPEDFPNLPSHVRERMVFAEKGQVTERDVMTCSHCQRGVVLNPGRVRDRAVCLKCHHYICDECEALRVKTGQCVPFKAVLDAAANIAEQHTTVPDGPRIVLTDIH